MDSYKTAPVKASRIPHNKEAFPEPELKEDRFAKMKLDKIEGYVDTRSVDDEANVSVDQSAKNRK